MDKISPIRRSANMRRIRSCDTVPELIVRRLVHRMGYRFRLHRTDLPAKPDLVFPSRRKVILVHGCFWHQHSSCREGRIPSTRVAYWGPKLTRNVQRDVAALKALKKSGWQTLVVWECETKDLQKLAKRLARFLAELR